MAMLELLFFAVVAVVVLGRLYQVLGRKTGAEPPPPGQRGMQKAPAGPARRDMADDRPLGDDEDGDDVRAAPAPETSSVPGVAAVQAADPSFSPSGFMAGARMAYEMIVTAYAEGDRDQLRALLNPVVFEAYDQSITARAASGEAAPELVRLISADLAGAEIDGRMAEVTVAYRAELAHGVNGIRVTNERWTFEREIGSRDPNWRLSAVDAD
jgi:predicted lipid-binding transport protein (Tim44 family)